MQIKYENFTIENCAFPYGICNTCRIHAGKFQQGKTKILPEMPYYSDMILPRPTRADQDPNCFCYKCLTGSDTRPQNSVKTMPKIIKLGSGLLGSSTENSLPKVPRAEKRIYDQVCQICRQEIGKGLVQQHQHLVVKQVLKLPGIQQEHIASALLEIQAKQSGNNDFTLSTKGSKATVSFNSEKTKEAVFFSESLDNCN